jgi:hypothetical protein
LEFANRNLKKIAVKIIISTKNNQPITHATTDLGNWLNGKLVLYLEDLANPKIGLNLVPNPL